MKLAISPWEEFNLDNQDGVKTQDTFKITIVDSYEIDINEYDFTRVRKVSTLQKTEPLTGNRSTTLVTQLDSTILVFEKGKDCNPLFIDDASFDSDKIKRMVPLPMFRYEDIILYTQYSRKSNYEIVALKKDKTNQEIVI